MAATMEKMVRDPSKPCLARYMFNPYEYGLSDHVSAELLFANLSSKQTFGTKHSVEGSFYLLDGLYHFRVSRKAQPYVLAGVGLINVYPHAETEISLQTSLNVGGGLEYLFSDKIVL